MDNGAVMEDDLDTNSLLQTLMMESSSFTRTRGLQGRNFQDSDIFCVRDSADEAKLPKTLDLTQRRSNVPISRKLSAKKKVNQIFSLLSKELHRIRRSRSSAIPESIVSSIVDSLGVQETKASGNDVFLVCKVDSETLELDALRKAGAIPQNLFDESGRVVDIGCTGTIKPFHLMGKPVPKTLSHNSTIATLRSRGLLKENGITDLKPTDRKEPALFLPSCTSAEPVRFGNVTRLSRKTEVIVNNHRNVNHFVPSAKISVPKFCKFFPDKPLNGSTVISTADERLSLTSGNPKKSQQTSLILNKSAAASAAAAATVIQVKPLLPCDISSTVASCSPTSSVSKPPTTSTSSSDSPPKLLATPPKLSEFKSSSALVADKLISNCS